MCRVNRMFKKIISTLLMSIFICFYNCVFAYETGESYIIEHLPDYKKTNTSTVKITASEAVVLPNNVIQIAFNSYFNSKNAQKGDFIDFSFPAGLHTVEGRFLLPAGTKITGCIIDVEKPKSFNRSAKVYILFNEVILPNGCVLPLKAYPDGENNSLKVEKWKSVGKVAAYTVGLFGVGSGLGAWIGSASHAAGKGAMVFGMPIGAGVGLIIGIVTPGLHYRAKCGKKIYIRLNECFIVPLDNIYN